MTPSPSTVDVLVVGLGPAGAAAARAAALAGAGVLALDRRAEPGTPVQCAEFVPSLIGQNTQRLLGSRTQSIEGMMTFLPGSAERQETFRGTMIDRRAFDAALVTDAVAAGARCRFASSVRSIGQDGTVALSDGSTVSAAVIIGADGPRSIVGSAIGRTNRALAETRQVTVELTEPFETTDIFLAPEIIGGYGWLFPRGRLGNLGIGIDAAYRGRLKPLLENLRGRLVAEGRIRTAVVGHTGGAIPVGGALQPEGTLGASRVLLAGDAAGLTNPVTGAGIASAVQSGAMAGEAAAAAVAGRYGAIDDYADEIADLFGPSLARAVRRRTELSAIWSLRSPTPHELRRGWIVFPEYWSNRAGRPPSEMSTHVMPQA